MFLMPFAFMMLEYRKRQRLAAHLVFSLHLFAFLLALLTVVYLVERVGITVGYTMGWIQGDLDIGQQNVLFASLVMVTYTALAMRRTYGDGWLGAIVKTTLFYFAYRGLDIPVSILWKRIVRQ
jgi:hypothetical protein